MKKSHSRWLFSGMLTASLLTLPWIWNVIETRTVSPDPKVQYLLGLNSVLGRFGLNRWASGAFYEAHRIREDAVFLDYFVTSPQHADALLQAAFDVSVSLGPAGTWGTNQDQYLDERGVLRFRVSRLHEQDFRPAIEAADRAFR